MSRRWVASLAAVAVLAAAAGLVWRLRTDDTGRVDQAVPVETVLVDGATLRVSFLVGDEGCGSSAGVEAEEGEREVRLTARVRYDTTDGTSVCPLAARRVTEEVTLSRPLDGRPLIDTATGRRVVAATPPPAGERA